ncbi:hypothetical protein BDQ12DRAFT_651100 [Crucibulum laeve]|uniref:MARVEL domain-containing protein n=1 Tax=Crucibulum laeve TaxID=68775 RepID=A0A5C3M207_9AGAR|nr:hypothetical protein BDQ12DRAFT_651100 [Crucibulum laeve]
MPASAHTGEKGTGEVSRRKFVPSLRSILYALAFFLAFALTVTELGLVSQQLHKYGNQYTNYASMEYKNALGLLLAAVIMSLLFTLFHFQLGPGQAAFIAFILAVFFGTGAGVVFQTTPFKGTSCGRPASAYPEKWQPYAHECSKIVSIQAVAWTLWGLYIFIMIGSLMYKLGIRIKPTPGGFYSV